MASNQNQMKQVNTSKQRGRGYLLWLGRILVAALGLIVIGAVYESVAEASDVRAYPPPGQMVDVGGYRLHINCTGTGSPTVVIDAGLGDWSTIWGPVQTGVAKATRVCIYDRAGMGWSEPGPMPRDAQHLANELHTLLHNANIPGPYVMVGHSMGGLPIRVFVHNYSSEVAGVVLIESMSPKQFTQSSVDAQSQSESLSRPFSIPALLARFGIVRLLAKPLGLVTSVPSDEKAYFALSVRPQSIQALTDEMQGMPASGAQAAAVRSFGDMPLIVLTARLDNNPPNWQVWQTELLQLSSNSQQLFAESGHNIEIEQPDAAGAAIVKMIEQIR